METLAVQQDAQNGRVDYQYISDPMRETITHRIQVDMTEAKITMVGLSVDIETTILSYSAEKQTVEQKFHRLKDQWRKETGHLSSATKKAMHPAYQQIIGMGQTALPLIIEELRRTRGHWLWALFAITGEDPASEGCTFSEAVDAWLSWGTRHGYATPD